MRNFCVRPEFTNDYGEVLQGKIRVYARGSSSIKVFGFIRRYALLEWLGCLHLCSLWSKFSGMNWRWNRYFGMGEEALSRYTEIWSYARYFGDIVFYRFLSVCEIFALHCAYARAFSIRREIWFSGRGSRVNSQALSQPGLSLAGNGDVRVEGNVRMGCGGQSGERHLIFAVYGSRVIFFPRL